MKRHETDDSPPLISRVVTGPQAFLATPATSGPPCTTVGIDVGGPRKGFHAVALSGGAYAAQLATSDAEDLAHWCRSEVQASVIAIDAPCRWSTDGRARPCERELRQQGIICFASPTRQAAVAHPTGDYDWMLQGEALYRALEVSHPLVARLPINVPGFFEPFPHAITWHLRGGQAQASQKRAQRRELLQQAGTPHCLDGPPGSQGEEGATAEEALEAVAEVWEVSRERLLKGDLDLLVLDELGLAIALGYLSAEAVIEALEQRPAHLDVILTGPSMPASLMAMADQVTQLRRGG